MKYTCYAFDVDFTLTHFADGLDSLIEAVRVHCDIPVAELNKILTTVTESKEGYSHKTFTAAIAGVQSNVNCAEIENTICRWLDAQLVRYEDAEGVFASLKQMRVSTALITAGNDVWQREKIRAAELKTDFTYIVSPTTGKAFAMQDLISKTGSPIIYVDDRPEELDRIRDMHGPESVDTVWILRDDSPHRDSDARHEHKKIFSLRELLNISQNII